MIYDMFSKRIGHCQIKIKMKINIQARTQMNTNLMLLVYGESRATREGNNNTGSGIFKHYTIIIQWRREAINHAQTKLAVFLGQTAACQGAKTESAARPPSVIYKAVHVMSKSFLHLHMVAEHLLKQLESQKTQYVGFVLWARITLNFLTYITPFKRFCLQWILIRLIRTKQYCSLLNRTALNKQCI